MVFIFGKKKKEKDVKDDKNEPNEERDRNEDIIIERQIEPGQSTRNIINRLTISPVKIEKFIPPERQVKSLTNKLIFLSFLISIMSIFNGILSLSSSSPTPATMILINAFGYISFFLGVMNLSLYSLLRKKQAQAKIFTTLYLGNFKEETPVGIYLGNFNVKIADRHLYGVIIHNNRRTYKIVLLWGHPSDAICYIKNKKHKTKRMVLRGIPVSMDEAIIKGFDVKKRSKYGLFDADTDEIDHDKIAEIKTEMVENGLGEAIFIIPYGEDKVSELFGEGTIDRMPYYVLENVMLAKRYTDLIDGFVKTTNEYLYELIKPLTELYRNIVDMNVTPIELFSLLYNVEVNQLKATGLFESARGSPKDIIELSAKLKEFASKLGNVLGVEGVNENFSETIDILREEIRKVKEEMLQYKIKKKMESLSDEYEGG